MNRIKISVTLVAMFTSILTPAVNAAEIQNLLYVTGNSPKETRTSVASGTSTGFGVTNLQNISIGDQVSLSDNSAHIVDSLGRVWGWGNDGREVGVGSVIPVTQARIIQTSEKITQIASGNNHTLALSESGKVYAWGWNGHGQIGLGENLDYDSSWNYSSPIQVTIPGGRTVKYISAGGYQSFALATDNSIWGWGINGDYSLLGTGGYSSVYTPTLIRVPSGFIPIKLVTDGGRYTLVLSQAGSVIGWGSNGNSGNGLGVSGQIQSPTLIFPQTASIVDIAVNGAATYVLNSSGVVYSAGYNGYGQLGSSNHPGGNSFAAVALPKTFIVKKIFGSIGGSNAWAVNAMGETYAWGAGSNDTLGTGYSGSVFTPVALNTVNNYGIKNIVGHYTQSFAIVSNEQRIEADAKAAADLRAKQEADAKAAADLRAKQEADAKVASDLRAKQEADTKVAQEADRIISEAKAEAARIVAEAKSKITALVKKKTINCTKGKSTKKITGINPKCPSGYKVKK